MSSKPSSKPASKAPSKENLTQSRKPSLKGSKLTLAPEKTSVRDLTETKEEKALSRAYYGPEPIPGIVPLFLTSQSQALFKVVVGEDVSEQVLYRMIPKSDIIADMQTRLAISDFTPFKKEILQYPKEELLLHYDPEFKYGQNFFIGLDPIAVDFITKEPEQTKEQEETKQVQKARKIEYAREYKSLGSEKEIDAEKVVNIGPNMTVKMTRKAGEFKQPCKFGDRDSVDAFFEVRPFRDANYDLIRSEMNIGVQVVPVKVDREQQTNWNRPINFQVQYEPIEMEQQEKDEILESEDIEEFIRNVSSRFEKALQENEMFDIMKDDYKTLGEEENVLDQGHHTVLLEYQSFTDLQNSKGMCLSCIDWHPTLKNIIAVSCTKRMSFEDRVDQHVLTRPKYAYILIWSFNDPIHPQMILEAPDDIYCFRFNPVDPNILIGGCENGQLVLWDISEHAHHLKASKAADTLEDDTREKTFKTPTVKWELTSSIEASHRLAVQDLHWLPQNFELGNHGDLIESPENGHKQLVTCSLDGTVGFWDLRQKKEMKALDLTWRPFIRVPLQSMDNSFDYALTRVSINTFVEGSKEKPSSGGTERKEKAKQWTSKFYCSTEEGDLIYADWMVEQKGDEKQSRVESCHSLHYGCVSDLHRSPFFPDVLLSVGGWSFHIWKEKNNMGPLLSSGMSQQPLTCGKWSPTRPGVFYIGRADGVIEVWDLLDKSHTFSTTQSITATAISNIQIQQNSKYGQFIAVGDDDGTLHILETPRNLQRPTKNEKLLVNSFFEREGRRLQSSYTRKQERVRDKAAYEQAAPKVDQLSVAKASTATGRSGRQGS
ncbi:WD40-repeat-containing domain protein [Gorgonomyces haynaldii]|nr:WD40-repeat-containing domain protein [Gorgonomyces haynaldii]